MSLTLQQRAYRHVRDHIILGHLRPGEHVTEARLAKELAISRGPVREALRELTCERILDFNPHSGARVRMPDAQELDAMIDLRASIESGIAARAAERISQPQLDELIRQFEQVRSISRHVRDAKMQHFDEQAACAITKADLQFHGVLMEAANSPQATRILMNLGVLSYSWVRHRGDYAWGALADICSVLREHARILRGVKRRDPNAARSAMLTHVLNSRPLYRPSLDKQGASADASAQLWPTSVMQVVAQFERSMLGEV